MVATEEQAEVQQAQWFESWFDSAHYHRLYAHRDEAEAEAFVDALIDRLHPAGHADALDLGCGAGRHARRLAARGLSVTGLDLSAQSIAAAGRFEQPGLRFRRHDMRQPFGGDAFDYVFNLFTSFGYFSDLAEHFRVVGNMAAALRPGGRLIVDYLNVRFAETRLVAAESTTIDEVTYRIERWTDRRNFYKRIVIDDPDRAAQIAHEERVARFSREDFRVLFLLHGLELEAVYGDYRLGPYDVESSPRLIMFARKPAAASRRDRATGAEWLPWAS